VGVKGKRNRIAVSGLAGLIALSAFCGSIGMISGMLQLNPAATKRLPFESPVFAGFALAVVVGLPSATVATLAWRRHPRSGEAAALAGVLLVGWIGVEILIVREFSLLQPICAGLGTALVVLGNPAMLRQVGAGRSHPPINRLMRHH
jgi:hypothetical protein